MVSLVSYSNKVACTGPPLTPKLEIYGTRGSKQRRLGEDNGRYADTFNKIRVVNY
jgi:hypothetical protein